MTLSTLLRTLRDRWLYLVAGVLAGLVVAGAVCWVTPRTYDSTSTLYVSARGDQSNAQNAYQGGLLSQQRIKSYSELMVSDRVLGDVVARLAPGETVPDLARQVAVSSSSDSTIIGVTVSDRSPQRAAVIADAIAGRFVDVVGQLERPTQPGQAPTVTVDVVDRADVPTTPVTPKIGVALALGIVLGLVVAAALALLRDALDTRVRTAGELAEISGSTAVGTLPRVPALVGATAAPPVAGAYGEAVRRLRTNLLFASVDEPASTLAITSSLPAEGKTTLVCALAAALAQTARVVVVEGDLRRPTIAARLGLAGEVGLSDVLARRLPLSDAVQRWDDVDVLVCGTVPPNPNELLTSRYARELVERLDADYDYVIIDGPPLLPVADGAILAGYAKCTVLLARDGVTTRSQVEKATEALRLVGARLFGTVLTMTAGAGRTGPYAGYYGYRGTTPEPTALPTALPVPSPVASREPTPEPAVKVAPEPAPEPTPEPAPQPTAEPVVEARSPRHAAPRPTPYRRIPSPDVRELIPAVTLVGMYRN